MRGYSRTLCSSLCSLRRLPRVARAQDLRSAWGWASGLQSVRSLALNAAHIEVFRSLSTAFNTACSGLVALGLGS